MGNEAFNYTKYFTDFYGFSGNRSNRMLYESWTPTRTDAILPMLDVTDNYSFQPSTYYVEDASYLRAKVVQLGYTFAPSFYQKLILITQGFIYRDKICLLLLTTRGLILPWVRGTMQRNNGPALTTVTILMQGL